MEVVVDQSRLRLLLLTKDWHPFWLYPKLTLILTPMIIDLKQLLMRMRLESPYASSKHPRSRLLPLLLLPFVYLILQSFNGAIQWLLLGREGHDVVWVDRNGSTACVWRLVCRKEVWMLLLPCWHGTAVSYLRSSESPMVVVSLMIEITINLNFIWALTLMQRAYDVVWDLFLWLLLDTTFSLILLRRSWMLFRLLQELLW